MASPVAPKFPPKQRRARKSIAHLPSTSIGSNGQQDNQTENLTTYQSQSELAQSKNASKKSRSKSMGPGGLDALKETSGNRRKVSCIHKLSELDPCFVADPY